MRDESLAPRVLAAWGVPSSSFAADVTAQPLWRAAWSSHDPAPGGILAVRGREQPLVGSPRSLGHLVHLHIAFECAVSFMRETWPLAVTMHVETCSAARHEFYYTN